MILKTASIFMKLDKSIG